MGDAQNTLLSLAEVAIALAGFSAIVVVLKRSVEGKWSAAHADQFNGMVIHAVFAVVFCLLPMLFNIVVQDISTTLHILCAVMGVQVVLHSVAVMFFSTTAIGARISLGFGMLIASSVPEARTLVSFFSFIGLTVRSLPRLCKPTTMPS